MTAVAEPVPPAAQPATAPLPAPGRSGGQATRLAGRRWGAVGSVALLVVALVLPWLPFVTFEMLGTFNLAAYYAMVAISLVVITGWVGQISLGHAGLVGIGAYVTGHVVASWHITFPVNLLWAGLAAAAAAAALGVVALRVRGLYLAVATLIFSWMASEFLFGQDWFTRHSGITLKPFGEPGTFPYFDFTSRRTYYYLAWAAVAAAVFLMANLRDSKTGRAFFAVRGSEVAAASLGISVMRAKLTAFAVSGFLAGVAGNLLMVRDQVVTPDAFKVEVSLFFLAVAVVGGLSSLGGAVAASLLFAALNQAFFEFSFLSGWLEVVPPLLLTTVLLLYRGGLAEIPSSIESRLGVRIPDLLDRAETAVRRSLRALRDRVAPAREPSGESVPFRRSGRLLDGVAGVLPGPVAARLTELRQRSAAAAAPPEGRLDFAAALRLTQTARADADDAPTAVEESVADEQPAGPAEPAEPVWRRALPAPDLPEDRSQRRVLVEVSGVTVRFGGLVAVNDVSLTVRENEIVGLIGPNGAGKTTTFNSIAGLNVPTAGRVSIFGRDVTKWTVDQRARLGVGRTFQAIQLLPQLTAFENLLVATHLENTSGLFAHLVVARSTLEAERAARLRVRQVSELLELDQYLDRQVKDLPFGVLRMVELARALVTGSKVIMLDEPASGLDNTETERLADILRFVRGLGVTLLLIEHDVQMVTAVSDYMYVLDHGALLAEGTPREIQRDPRVIAAYLGESPADDDELVEAGA